MSEAKVFCIEELGQKSRQSGPRVAEWGTTGRGGPQVAEWAMGGRGGGEEGPAHSPREGSGYRGKKLRQSWKASSKGSRAVGQGRSPGSWQPSGEPRGPGRGLGAMRWESKWRGEAWERQGPRGRFTR